MEHNYVYPSSLLWLVPFLMTDFFPRLCVSAPSFFRCPLIFVQCLTLFNVSKAGLCWVLQYCTLFYQESELPEDTFLPLNPWFHAPFNAAGAASPLASWDRALWHIHQGALLHVADIKRSLYRDSSEFEKCLTVCVSSGSRRLTATVQCFIFFSPETLCLPSLDFGLRF